MGEVLWLSFVLVAAGVAYGLGVQRGRAEDYVQRDRSAAVAECSHALAELQDGAQGMCASYLLALHDAHRVVVHRWLEELNVDACDEGAVIEALRAPSPTRREPDPVGVAVELVGEPRRSWLLNHGHIPR